MSPSINLTRRVRRRKLKSGAAVEQVRFVLNWRDPRTGAREQRFFERQRDAQERRAELVAAFDRGALSRCHASSASGLGLTDFQATATASRHVVIAAARSTR